MCLREENQRRGDGKIHNVNVCVLVKKRVSGKHNLLTVNLWETRCGSEGSGVCVCVYACVRACVCACVYVCFCECECV